MIHKSVT